MHIKDNPQGQALQADQDYAETLTQDAETAQAWRELQGITEADQGRLDFLLALARAQEAPTTQAERDPLACLLEAHDRAGDTRDTLFIEALPDGDFTMRLIPGHRPEIERQTQTPFDAFFQRFGGGQQSKTERPAQAPKTDGKGKPRPYGKGKQKKKAKR